MLSTDSGEPIRSSSARIELWRSLLVTFLYTTLDACETDSNSLKTLFTDIEICVTSVTASGATWLTNDGPKLADRGCVPAKSSSAGFVFTVTWLNRSWQVVVVGQSFCSLNSRRCHSLLSTKKLVRIWPKR